MYVRKWWMCIMYARKLLGEKEHNADFEGSNLQKEREKGEFLTFEGFSFPFYEEQFVHI